MSRKLLAHLRAEVENGAVCLSAYKSTPAFQTVAVNASPDPFRIIRIYRKEEPDFAFGEDYAEYFDGCSRGEAKLIFEGTLPAHNDRKFIYEDQEVETGKVYVYWMAGAEGDSTGSVSVKVRDPEVWWSQARIETEIAALKLKYPDMVRVECIGKTVKGRDIKAIRVGSSKPAVSLIGAVHAGESGPELIIPAINRVLSERADLLSHVGITAIPAVNIDERERLVRGVPWYLRENANGVDLNRNFPVDWDTIEYGYGLDSSDPHSATYRGPFAASEPETCAMMAFLEDNPPETVYSFHCLASICGMRMGGAKCAEGDLDYRKKCRNATLAYLRGMAPAFSSDQKAEFFCSAGSLASWCYREFSIPAFDIEISPQLEPYALAQCRVDKTDVSLLMQYQERHFGGLLAALKETVVSKEL